MTVQNTPSLWHSWSADTPADLAGLYRQAAKLIEAEGYNPCADSIRVDAASRAPGHNVETALEAAATLAYRGNAADAADLAEDGSARLGGWLIFTGLDTRRTSIHDICDVAAGWEACRPGAGWWTKAEVQRPHGGTDVHRAGAPLPALPGRGMRATRLPDLQGRLARGVRRRPCRRRGARVRPRVQ